MTRRCKSTGTSLSSGSGTGSTTRQRLGSLSPQSSIPLKILTLSLSQLIFAYDEPLSHLIYAGSDMILVPSMFEPCGLTQLIAMRYGAIPVVRQTGGLRDTVFDVDHDAERSESEGKRGTNGFTFEGADQGGMDYALHRAIDRWYGGGEGQEAWEDLVVRVMAQDWSWNEPAMEYMDLYYAAKER